MTTALAFMAPPIILSRGESFHYLLAPESAEIFIGALKDIFQDASEELSDLEMSLREGILKRRFLKLPGCPLELLFSGYHGFRFSGGSSLVRALNEDLRCAKWQY